MTTHLHIALPCFGGLMQAVCARSVLLLTHELSRHGVGWSLDLELHESLVQRARNNLAHRMLKNSDATHLLFIDADIEFRPIDVIGMLGADKPLVCGAYPKKTLDVDAIAAAVRGGDPNPMAHAANYAINVLPSKDGATEATLTSDRACVPILDAPTGFMLVRREVLVDMAAAHPECLYYSDQGQNRGEAIHALFDCAIVEGRYLSEDYLFSRRWQNLGGTVWLFLPAVLGHVGSYTYRGDLSKTFEPVKDAMPVNGFARMGTWAHPASSVAPDGGATEWCDIPSLPDSDPQKRWHLERYEWAAKLLTGNMVANAACGTNYGTPILQAKVPYRRVVGFDRSVAALMTNKSGEWKLIDDLHDETFVGFDSVVSLETIEHLERPWEWIAGLAPNVKELILSVPVIPTKHANKFHLHDFTAMQITARIYMLGWRITDDEYQTEFQSKAVLLLRAVR